MRLKIRTYSSWMGLFKKPNSIQEQLLTVLHQKRACKLETKDVIFHVKVEMLFVKHANGHQNLLQLVKYGKKFRGMLWPSINSILIL